MASPMSKVNELTSASLSEYLNNRKTGRLVEFLEQDPTDFTTAPKQIWVNTMENTIKYTYDGGVTIEEIEQNEAFIIVTAHGVTGNGVTDDTAALQTLIDTSIAEGKKAIYFPHTITGGQYLVTAITNAEQVVFFGDNASFIGGYTGKINQLGDWASTAQLEGLGLNAKTYGLKGDGVTDDYAALSALITEIGTAEATIIFPVGTYKISTSITIPSNINLYMTKGAMLSPDSGDTITINGPVEAGLWKIFTGSGTIAGSIDVEFFYPQWWGAAGDGITDDSDAIQECIEYCFLNRKTVVFTEGTFIVTQPIKVYTRVADSLEDITSLADWVSLKSSNQNVFIKKTTQTTFNGIDCIFYIMPYEGAETSAAGLSIENISLVGSGTGQYGLAANTNEYGMYFSTALFSFRFSNMMIRNVKIGINQVNNMNMGRFEAISCWTKTTGFLIQGFNDGVSNTSMTFLNCYAQFQDDYGYKLSGHYSSLQNCGADGIQGTAYGLLKFSGTLVGCGAENSNGLQTFEIDSGNVTITNFATIANQFDKVDTVIFNVKNLAICTVINGKVNSSAIVGGNPTNTVASGKLFAISGNSRIKFIGTRMPDLGFDLESDWAGLERSSVVGGLYGDSFYNATTNKPNWVVELGVYRDALGILAFKYYLLRSLALKQTFTVFQTTAAYTFTQTGNVITTGVGGVSQDFIAYTPIDLTNFNYMRITHNLTVGILNFNHNNIRIGVQPVGDLGTETDYTWSRFSDNFTGQQNIFNFTSLDKSVKYNLVLRGHLGTDALSAFTSTITEIIFSDTTSFS